MPTQLNELAAEAIEVDAFSTNFGELVPQFKNLYSLALKRFHKVPSSNITAAGGVTRPSARVQLRVQGGVGISQGTGDNDALPSGGGSQYAGFALSPVVIYASNQYTWLAKQATQGKDRGTFNVTARELKYSLQAAETGIEGLMNADGSGAIDEIPTTATITTGGSGPTTSIIAGMNNVAGFSDQQVVQIFPSIGGTTRGNATISFVDPVTNTLNFSTALPSTGGATQAGDFVVIAGSSGAQQNSILGLRLWQNNSNTGTLAGLNRANYPSRLQTPTINLAGGPLTQSVGLRAATLMDRAQGEDSEATESGIWYGGYDQAMAVANLYFNVLIANAQDVKGDEALDTGKKKFAPTFCSREFMPSITALPGRLDLFCPDTWYMFETAPLELYDFGGGSTIMPVPNTSGTYNSSYLMTYVTAFNVANSNPRAGCFVQNAGQPVI